MHALETLSGCMQLYVDLSTSFFLSNAVVCTSQSCFPTYAVTVLTFVHWKKSFIKNLSLELICRIYQPFSSVFLSQQISEQYFQPWLISQANRAYRCWPFDRHLGWPGYVISMDASCMHICNMWSKVDICFHNVVSEHISLPFMYIVKPPANIFGVLLSSLHVYWLLRLENYLICYLLHQLPAPN